MSANAQRRWLDILQALGKSAVHSLVLLDGASASDTTTPKGFRITVLDSFPPLPGKPFPGRLHRQARAMLPFDIVLTYGPDTLNAVMAYTAFSRSYPLPPLIHHEGCDGALPRGNRRLDWYRRIALGKTAGLVVPDEVWEARALVDWQQPIGRVKRIAFGMDAKSYGGRIKAGAMPNLIKHPGERWIATAISPDAIDDLAPLLATLRTMPDHWHLLAFSAASARDDLNAAADEAGLYDRVHLIQPAPVALRAIGLADALVPLRSADLIVEAMAASVPVLVPKSAPVNDVLPKTDRVYLQDDDGTGLRDILLQLDGDRKLAVAMGEANRKHVLAHHDHDAVIAQLRRLYESAMAQGSTRNAKSGTE